MNKAEIRAAMMAIAEKAQSENRGMTEEEQRQFNDLKAQKSTVEAIDDLKDEEQRDLAKPDLKVKGERRSFSVTKAVNDVLNRRAFEGAEADMVKRGREQFGASAINASGSIVLPIEERAALTASTGVAAIATDIQTVLDPLYYAETLNALGVTRLSGLRGDVSVPAYGGTTVAWAAETGAAADGTGSLSAVTYAPKRLTAYVAFSKQFLLQDSANVEACVRRDLLRAISAKVESTVFGSAASSSTQPGGIFNGLTQKTAATTYADVLALESALEANKLMTNPKYLLSIEAKEQLRQVGVGTSTTQFGLVYDKGEVLGTTAVTSGNVATKGIALADWSEFVLAQWGGLDITVDDITLAGSGQIKLIVNAYFDGGFRRANAFSAAVLK